MKQNNKELNTQFLQIQEKLQSIIVKTEENQVDLAPQKHIQTKIQMNRLNQKDKEKQMRHLKQMKKIKEINLETKDQLENIKKERIGRQINKIEVIANEQPDVDNFLGQLGQQRKEGKKGKQYNKFTKEDLNLIRCGKSMKHLKHYDFNPEEMQQKQNDLDHFLQEEQVNEVLFDFQKLLNPEEDLLAKQEVNEHDDEIEIQNYTYLQNSTLNKIIKINNEIKHHMLQLEHEQKMKKIQDIQYIQNQQIFGSIGETGSSNKATTKKPIKAKRLSLMEGKSQQISQLQDNNNNNNDFNSYFQQQQQSAEVPHENQRECRLQKESRQLNPTYSQQTKLLRKQSQQQYNSQHYTIDNHDTINAQNLQKFPLKKDDFNNEVSRKLIQDQFYSNMLYKNNQIEEEQIKVLHHNNTQPDRPKVTSLLPNPSLKRKNDCLHEQDTETTISNKPKYLSKLNIYKGVKLRQTETQQTIPLPEKQTYKQFFKQQNVIDNRNTTQPVNQDRLNIYKNFKNDKFYYQTSNLTQARKKQEDIPKKFLKNSNRNLESISCQEFWKNNF